MKKVHDNSINITVDLWRRARDFFGALPCTFASLRSLTTSAKTVHRTVFFRRQVCFLLVRIPLFIFANAKSRPCDLLFVLANNSNFDRNRVRGYNYGLEGGSSRFEGVHYSTREDSNKPQALKPAVFSFLLGLKSRFLCRPGI